MRDVRRHRKANYEAPEDMAWRFDAGMLNEIFSGHCESVGVTQQRGVHTDDPFPTYHGSFPPDRIEHPRSGCDVTSASRCADNHNAMDGDSMSPRAA